jgi:hypothetical protein
VYQVKDMSLLATLVYVIDKFYFLQVRELETKARGKGRGRAQRASQRASL